MIEVTDASLQKAAGEGMDEFIQVFTDKYKAVSVDAENIKSVDSKPKFSLVTVDHHNVIIIRRKLTGQFISDFPITYNHNLHSLSL